MVPHEQELHTACGACRACPLALSRQQVVVSRGDPSARLMLIGEGPGAQEDATGLPFVGRSGQLLDELLAAAGIQGSRETYICNMVKCRPPGNRRPTGAELAACRPWLERQLEAVDPALVVLLGATAVEGVLDIRGGITQLRGRWRPWRGRWLMPLLHPSYLLRFGSTAPGSPRALTAADLRAVRHRLDRLEDPSPPIDSDG
jgi:DNA polymerase